MSARSSAAGGAGGELDDLDEDEFKVLEQSAAPGSVAAGESIIRRVGA